MEMNRITDAEIAELLTWPIQSLGVKCQSALLELQSRRKNDAITADLLTALKAHLKFHLSLADECFSAGTDFARGRHAGIVDLVQDVRAAIQKAEGAGL